MPDYDAFLLVSFGGPEGPGDVMPFLRNVTRGRGIPDERLAAVAEHYYAVGGVSPINQQCRDLIEALREQFPAAGLDLPIYWGNRNWDPYLTGTVATMAADGVQRAVAFVTSAYSSFSSCRQYLDDLDRARAAVGPGAPRIDKVRRYFNHPGFIEPFAEGTRAALDQLPAAGRDLVPARKPKPNEPGVNDPAFGVLVTVTSVPTPYSACSTVPWAFLTPADAAVTVITRPTPRASPSAMKMAWRMRRRSSRRR